MSSRLFARRLVAWLAIASVALLIAPAVANALFVLSVHTSQGRSVRLRVSDHLSKVTRVMISWQAQCASGATLIKGSRGRAVVIPFPIFISSGTFCERFVNRGDERLVVG